MGVCVVDDNGGAVMDELHKQTLEALGFWARPSRLKFVALLRGQGVVATAKTEADAWAQAPTLEALMPKLVEAIGQIGAILTETVFDIPMVQVSLMTPAPLSGRIVWDYGDCQGVGTTYTEAVASVFVQMCEAGLIDGKAVVL